MKNDPASIFWLKQAFRKMNVVIIMFAQLATHFGLFKLLDSNF